MKRHKTAYPGVFYREVDRIGGRGKERMFYVLFKKDDQLFEEKVGRQHADDMTAARAARIRAERIEGKRPSRKEIREKKKATKDKPTLSFLWEQYKKNNPGLKGLKYDESRFKTHIKTSLGSKIPVEIDPLSIERLRINLQKKLSIGTVKNTLELVRRIINFGVKKKLCAAPSFKVSLPRVNNVVTEDLTPNQMKNLLTAIHEDHDQQGAAVMLIALSTGMRKREILSLGWQDINFERGFIAIRNPKGGTDATIPLNDTAKSVFDRIAKTENPLVFPGIHGNQRSDIKRTANRIREKADLPKDFRPLHGLRHVYASMLASSGQVDLYTLSKLLTHKDVKMTSRYAHLRDETMRRASNLAGSMIDNALQAESETEVSNG